MNREREPWWLRPEGHSAEAWRSAVHEVADAIGETVPALDLGTNWRASMQALAPRQPSHRPSFADVLEPVPFRGWARSGLAD